MGSLLQCLWLIAKGKGWIQFLQISSKVLPWDVGCCPEKWLVLNNKSSFWRRDYQLHETLAVSLLFPYSTCIVC